MTVGIHTIIAVDLTLRHSLTHCLRRCVKPQIPMAENGQKKVSIILVWCPKCTSGVKWHVFMSKQMNEVSSFGIKEALIN